jgi:hypothetical protein
MAANRPAIAFPKITALGISLALITGGVWATQTLLAPPQAQAYKSRVDVNLDRLRDETYQSFIRRAEIVARAAAQRSFDRDILASEVSIMVIGRHNGTETPVLLLEVSREKWRERPDTRRWATYYRTAQTLLKLPSAGVANIPNAAPAVPQPIPAIEPVNVPPTAPVTVPPPSPAAVPQQAVPQQAVPQQAVPQPTVTPSPAAAPIDQTAPAVVPVPARP